MTSGVVFAGELSQSAAEVMYTPGANVLGVVNVNYCNRGSNPVSVRLGYAGSATTSASYYYEYGAIVAANGGVLERTRLIVSGTQSLIGECETASRLDVIVTSMEDTL